MGIFKLFSGILPPYHSCLLDRPCVPRLLVHIIRKDMQGTYFWNALSGSIGYLIPN